jgi:hypothetical protein
MCICFASGAFTKCIFILCLGENIYKVKLQINLSFLILNKTMICFFAGKLYIGSISTVERAGHKRMAYLESPGFSGTAFDSSSGFGWGDNQTPCNCTLCPCHGSLESRGCSAGRWACRWVLCTCEFEACPMCPQCTATSIEANRKAVTIWVQVLFVKEFSLSFF